MLGQINEWFYHDLAGIQADPAVPGFKHILIRPAIVGDLTFVRASYNSVRGMIASQWSRGADNTLVLDITIPPNTSATVDMPTTDIKTVRESGRPVAEAPAVRFLNRSYDGRAIYEISSGHYTFTASFSKPSVPDTGGKFAGTLKTQ